MTGTGTLLPRATEASLDLVRQNCPPELKALHAWVAGDRRPRKDGKSSKIPINPTTGGNAASDDPATWGTFDDACACARRVDAFGVGVNLLGSEFLGLDLDHVVDPQSGDVNPRALALLEQLPYTYVEVSPSGTGLRAFLRGKKPPRFDTCNIANAFGEGTALEVYDGVRGRYLTVTGNVRNVAPIASASEDDLAPLLALLPQRKPSPSRNGTTLHRDAPAGSDAEHDLERVPFALEVLDASMAYPEWLRVGAALKTLGDEGLALWRTWSMQSPKYSDGDCDSRWNKLHGSSIASLFGMADDANRAWRDRCPKRQRAAPSSNGTHASEDEGPEPQDSRDNGSASNEVLRDRKIPRPQPVTFATGLDRWAKEGPLVHEPTGIVTIDELTGGGLCYGTRAVVIGAPDAGKTALVVQIADTYAQRGLAVGLLGIDEEPGDLIQRFLQRRGFSRRQCEVRDPVDLANMRRHVEGLGVRFYGDEFSIEMAAEDLANIARERGTGAFLGIDSLQTARSSLGVEATSRYEMVTASMRAMRTVAAHYRMITMGTSEMNRAAYRSTVAAEQTNDLAAAKESGSIEFQSRILVALRNVPDSDDLLELRFAKNKHGRVHRHGEPGLHLRIDRSSQTITEAKDYVTPAADEAGDARAAARDSRAIEDAATLAVALARHPGLGVVNLESKAKAATRGGMGHARFEHARGMLGDALIEMQGPRTKILLFLDGSLLPPEVLDAVPLANRPSVAASRPPSTTDSATADPTLPEHPRASPSIPGDGGATGFERDPPRPSIGGAGEAQPVAVPGPGSLDGQTRGGSIVQPEPARRPSR